MTTRVYKNFVEGTLASGIAGTGTTSMSVTFATNATVPVSSDFSSKHIYFVIDPEGAEHAPEIVKGTAISGSGPYDITIARSQNGTTAQVWDSGRKVVAALIEEDITNFATKDGTTFTGSVTVGVDGTGHDVKFFGDHAGAYVQWVDTSSRLDLYGRTGEWAMYVGEGNVYIEDTLDVDGTLETDALSINGTAVTATAAEINYLDNDDLVAGDITKLAAITADAADINVLDGVTGGTVTASKALVVDGNKDLASLRNVTLTGTLTVDSVGVTAVQTSSESFANNNTSLMTSAAIEDKILSYGYGTGNTTIHFDTSEPSAGGAGELWIKTS